MVGLVPLEAMLMAADYYLKKENLFIVSEEQKIRLVTEILSFVTYYFVDFRGIAP